MSGSRSLRTRSTIHFTFRIGRSFRIPSPGRSRLKMTFCRQVLPRIGGLLEGHPSNHPTLSSFFITLLGCETPGVPRRSSRTPGPLGELALDGVRPVRQIEGRAAKRPSLGAEN